MKYELGLGHRTEIVEIAETNVLDVLLPNPVDREVGGASEVERALREPIGAPRLSTIVKPGEKVAIVTSDITRPCPSHAILPAILDELYLGGIRAEDVTVVLALGSHRCHSEEERLHLLGERVCREVALRGFQSGRLRAHGRDPARNVVGHRPPDLRRQH